MTEKDLLRIVTESSHVMNGITTPEQFHNWLLDHYTVPCIECSGTGSYEDQDGNHRSCVVCNGLGIHPRKKVIQKETCIICDHYLPDSNQCKVLRSMPQNPNIMRCACFMVKPNIAQIR